MDTIITTLKDTPIPTIMVVAGIVFLLLSIAGQLAGRITVPPERQRQATIIGCLLVVVRVALHVVPPRLIPPQSPGVPAPTSPQPALKEDQPTQTFTPPPSTQLPPPTPQPTTQDVTVVSIPSLNARLTGLRFFEGNPHDLPPLKQRVYRKRFAKAITRDILTEMTLEYPKPERRIDFTIQAVYQNERGKVVDTPENRISIPTDGQESVHALGIGMAAYLPGLVWSVGSYTVDVYINGERVTGGSSKSMNEPAPVAAQTSAVVEESEA